MMLAVSPHCDDAVLACGERLCTHPGSLVVTVFAGAPDAGAPLTAWDRDCGFGAGDDVMAVRRAEDRCAFAHLRARGEWLGFRDRQYGASPPVHAVADALAAIVHREAPRDVCFPLGLFHSDHVLASDAVIGLVPAHPDIAWWAFEDALYRSLDNAVAERVDLLRRRRLLLEAVPAPPGAADTARRKHAAIACYRSQLRGLATPNRLGDRDARSPETYWRVRG